MKSMLNYLAVIGVLTLSLSTRTYADICPTKSTTTSSAMPPVPSNTAPASKPDATPSSNPTVTPASNPTVAPAMPTAVSTAMDPETPADVVTGVATRYTMTGQDNEDGPGPNVGACGFNSGLWPRRTTDAKLMLAAINYAMWNDSMNCGRCARVHNLEKKTEDQVVMIVDLCPYPCGAKNLDLSKAAMRKLAGQQLPQEPPGQQEVKWWFVPCPKSYVSGNMYYRLTEGSNPWYLMVNPQNSPYKIRTLQVQWNGSNGWKDFEKDYKTTGYFWVFPWRILQGVPLPYQLRTVFENGKVSGSSGDIWKHGDAIVGDSTVN